MPDLNIRSVPDDVVSRLQEQASAGGLSVSEFIRQTLLERANRATPAEIAALRARNDASPESRIEFDAFYSTRMHRRQTA